MWLKHLRLHKYTNYFIQMTYDEMMQLDDEKLIDANITMGARKKILNNIDKLKNRSKRLKDLCMVKIYFNSIIFIKAK
jgi:hypothetical protein